MTRKIKKISAESLELYPERTRMMLFAQLAWIRLCSGAYLRQLEALEKNMFLQLKIVIIKYFMTLLTFLKPRKNISQNVVFQKLTRILMKTIIARSRGMLVVLITLNSKEVF